MNKEIPLTFEWSEEPHNTYVYNSIDHLLRDQNLREDQNHHNVIIIKQLPDFYGVTLNTLNALNTQSVQNICRIHPDEISSKEDKEIRQQNNHSNVTEKSSQTDSSSKLTEVPPKKLTKLPERLHNKGRIDVVEMSMDSSGYKYIFIYEDQHSKFITLKALRSDTIQEVATRLLDVLAILGVPRVLQSGNGRKFAEQVVHELRTLWNDLIILHEDTPKCEISCKHFKSSLESWMRKNPAKTWREGLNFVQILHNTTYRCENGKVPYEVLFGRNGREKFSDLYTETNTKNLCTEEKWIECSSGNRNDDMIATTGNTQNTSDDVNVRITNDEEDENTQCAQNQDKSTKSNDLDDLVNMNDKCLGNNMRTMHPIHTDKTKVTDKLKIMFKCKYCQKQYTKHGYLENHMLDRHTPESLRCKVCCKKFSIQELFDKHMKQSHKR